MGMGIRTVAPEWLIISPSGFGGRAIGSPWLSRNSLEISRKEANVSGEGISALGKGSQGGGWRDVRGKLAGHFVLRKAKGGGEGEGMQPTW